MTLRTTKILACGFAPLAVALAATPTNERPIPDRWISGKGKAGEARSPGASNGESKETPSRRPSKARGRLKDESLATRLAGEGRVTVGGQVHNPGPVQIGEGTTLITAIQRAGGATEFGSLMRVSLIRGSKRTEINVKTPEGAGTRIEANDTVLVPQKMVIGR